MSNYERVMRGLHRDSARGNRRRYPHAKRKGKLPLPPSTRVILRQALVQRIYGESKPWTPPSHRFWVRGHFKHWTDPRYRFAVGTRTWTPPYIKGRGILVKKKYETPGVQKEAAHGR